MNHGSLDGFMGGFYKFGEYFILLVYLNLLWICFTILGGVIFGWAPSTTAVFSVLREKIMGKDPSVIKTFWGTYRQEFFRTNGLGLIILFVAYMLYVNIQFFQVETAWLFVAVRYLMIAIMIISGIMLIYIFPLIVHYETSLYRHIKNSLLMAIFKPIRTLFTIIACVVVSQLFFTFPVFIILFGVSLFALVIMWTTYYTFKMTEQKQEELTSQEV
ncbi:YesL family protein [Evansella sp. AB-rgal1]|uniref:YesL family protein n=1 Tax=Evansella sp. AB-rgal1 TaxID=3242696 RepID=UPI00359CC20A